MSYFWRRKGEKNPKPWEMVPVSSQTVVLSDAGEHLEPLADTENLAASAAVTATGSGTLLLAGSRAGVLVNGRLLPAQACLLADGDEVIAAGARFRYAAVDPPSVVPFPGSPKQEKCPRCHSRLELGSPAARCVCGLWYHQAGEMVCFAYPENPVCVSCGRVLSLNGAEPPALEE
jgi:hypothetical protein